VDFEKRELLLTRFAVSFLSEKPAGFQIQNGGN
jgi:hypothetical protein